MKFTENVLWIFSEYSQKNIQWIFTNEYSVNFQENSFSEFSVNIPKMQEEKRNYYYNFYMTGTVLPINTRKSPFWWEAEELEGHNFAWRVIYLCRNLFWSKLPSLTICPPPTLQVSHIKFYKMVLSRNTLASKGKHDAFKMQIGANCCQIAQILHWLCENIVHLSKLIKLNWFQTSIA